jgi:small GTP-binding protein
MSKDLEIIRQLQKRIGKKLEQRTLDQIRTYSINGFAIDNYGHVTGLNLEDTRLTDIPPLQGLRNLTTLRLGRNQLTDLIPLQGLSHLTTLNLGSNQLTDLTPLQGLRNLTHLHLHNNQLTDLTPLQGLRNLTHLTLHSNQLNDPTPLQGLRNLTTLDLGRNQLTDLTPLQGLKQLRSLHLSDNRIRELPEAFIHMEPKADLEGVYFSFDGIFLEDNPLERPPMEVVWQGTDAMKAWFRSQEEVPPKQGLNEVKVVLVGDGGSGKTSLVKQLLGETFDPHESQTHGIAIKPMKIHAGGTEIIARLWDFGGQEIMHATHRFFLSKRSLYILVLDGRKDEKTEYWLKHIQSFGGDSPTLVVINKTDQNPGYDVNRAFLKEKYKHIKDFFRLSCKKGAGIPEFAEALAQELSRVEMIRTSWARSWFNVKSHLETMPDHYISFDQYNKICLNQEIDDEISRETLVEFLNDLGVVLHFKEFDLRDTHVLEPGWATGAVYKIINSGQVAKCNGVLHTRRLDDILAKKSEKDYEYPRGKYRYIITLMKKFELCYPIDDDSVLVPDLLPIQEPTIQFDYGGALTFIVQYDFLPRGVMPRFIVNMHKDIKENLQWRTGVVLEDNDFQSTAVVKADHEARRMYIYVSGGQRRDYFAVLLAALRRINHSFEKLKTTELVPMPDDPEITANYKQLIQFEKRGIEFYPTGEGDKEYRVKDLLGTIAATDTTQEEILKLLRKLLDENDTPETAARKLSDAFIVQPTIMGVGVDFKKLIQKVLPKKKKK